MKINGMDFKWKVFHFYADSSHAWLKVDYAALYRLGLLRLVSPYSYQMGNWVYLEEDRDACMFLDALKKLGVKYSLKIHSHDNPSRIRTFKGYRCGTCYDNDEGYLKLEKNALDCYGLRKYVD